MFDYLKYGGYNIAEFPKGDLMPYLKIQMSAAVSGLSSSIKPSTPSTQTFLKKASRLVAQELSKPEDYVMVSLEPPNAMLFAGSAEPAAFLELRAIGLPVKKTKDLSRSLCELIESELGVPKERIFINYIDFAPNLWGWSGETF